ncbi:hypothetical protein [Bdellovibrio sp. KM01]|uniref:hypothetical protein n=1 Tax=Bdellovibrio sp. KM01 TaxID=2748865 RepID=UPI0015EABB9A|nr:hypothetical protein [Bdellovibrio sp. KM01]QLY24269.1 hypothetical protein HW988_12430 [Bdellovibrio sp. KM01]
MLSKFKVVVMVVLTLFMGLSTAQAANKKALIRMRQPQKVSPVIKSWQREVISDLFAATASAENLDSQLEPLMNAAGFSYIQKWKRGIDETSLQKTFSKDLKNHLQVMAMLFDKHTQYKKFDRVSEFEFQNLVRRSDYILSLPVSKNAIQETMGGAKFTSEFKTVLAEYNKVRQRFDSKSIQLALK